MGFFCSCSILKFCRKGMKNLMFSSFMTFL
nr:MAG TPA_asm: hypothetical protein [Caudoviricetes sp.]